jgi:hypothetical protein
MIRFNPNLLAASRLSVAVMKTLEIPDLGIKTNEFLPKSLGAQGAKAETRFSVFIHVRQDRYLPYRGEIEGRHI